MWAERCVAPFCNAFCVASLSDWAATVSSEQVLRFATFSTACR